MPKTTGKRFGLLGRTLGHSWSPQIHARMGSVPYTLFEREPDELADFFARGPWDGINVTIPYKRQAAEAADARSERVERLGVANTLVRRPDGSLFAENTDVLGFEWLLERFAAEHLGATPRDAFGTGEALVLGSGGASQAVQAALADTTDLDVRVISRTGADTYESLAGRHPKARLVVNTTPVGMFPHCPASPLEPGCLEALGELAGVIDVVYNPERTGICLEAERLGIPSASGLGMLVSQAFYASQLFQDTELDPALIGTCERLICASTRNIVLIGMPGAGKTSAGRALARLLGRPFVDLDDAFAVETGRSAEEFIRQEGELAFRAKETEVAASYGAKSGLVIACGGGIVTQERNYNLLHQNGTIAFIDRPLYQLATDGRPLSQRKGIERLANERMGLYRLWADTSLSCTGSAAGDAQLLKAKLGL